MPSYTLSDFDFNLPKNLIAQKALTKRSASRLMIVESKKENISDNIQSIELFDTTFANLANYLEPGDLLVYNNTEVIKARLYGEKISGGRVEFLIERIIGEYIAISQIRTSKKPKLGSVIYISEQVTLCIEEYLGQFYRIRFSHPCTKILEQYGQIPLPPYIRHQPEADDDKRYQTTFACVPGAIAAPTAGLHFDHTILTNIRLKGVQLYSLTLHVGAGTFSPIRCELLNEHKMHTELYLIPQKTIDAIKRTRKNGKKIIAIGTTTLRALESASLKGQFNENNHLTNPEWKETDLFITPGFKFQIVDKLVTNFHLPKSSLLILVSAFAGYQTIKETYQHAIRERYRFFSYGDAMLLSCISRNETKK